MTYILFAIVVLIQPMAQILEKHGMNQIGQINGVNLLLISKLISNPFVVSGVGLSTVSLILWLSILSRGNVSYFYPFGSISYIILALFSVLLLGEHLSMQQVFGIAVIVFGSILINIK